MELTTPVEPAAASRFSLDGYRALLAALQDRGYRFSTFSESVALLEQGARFVLMRHDIDFDLQAAARIAEIEAEAGVMASYFVLLRTNLYNAFSAEGSSAVNKTLDMGHQLGLHFDCAAYSPESTVRDLAEASHLEASILEQWFGREIQVVSYHRPSKLVLTGEPALSSPRSHTY